MAAAAARSEVSFASVRSELRRHEAVARGTDEADVSGLEEEAAAVAAEEEAAGRCCGCGCGGCGCSSAS